MHTQKIFPNDAWNQIFSWMMPADLMSMMFVTKHLLQLINQSEIYNTNTPQLQAYKFQMKLNYIEHSKTLGISLATNALHALTTPIIEGLTPELKLLFVGNPKMLFSLKSFAGNIHESSTRPFNFRICCDENFSHNKNFNEYSQDGRKGGAQIAWVFLPETDFDLANGSDDLEEYFNSEQLKGKLLFLITDIELNYKESNLYKTLRENYPSIEDRIAGTIYAPLKDFFVRHKFHSSINKMLDQVEPMIREKASQEKFSVNPYRFHQPKALVENYEPDEPQIFRRCCVIS